MDSDMRKQVSFLLLAIIAGFGIASAQTDRVTLLFAGDAMQHKSQLDAAKTNEGYDYSSYFKWITPEVDSADIAVVNLETTLPGKAYSGYPMFGSPDEFAFSLKNAGFDVFLTANNHCLDKGKNGVERTIATLDWMQVKHLGTYASPEKRELLYPFIMVKNGIRIAMLNYTYGTNGIEAKSPNVVNLLDKKQILADIAVAKLMNPDIIVANVHWGDEYVLQPNKQQKDWADFFIKNGVRLVIGSHPHVVEPIDIRRNGDEIESVIIYSLGNLVSGMKRVNTDGGMMATIEISKDIYGKTSIDTCSYSLVWVHKPIENGRTAVQLIPVASFDNAEGRKALGETAYKKMMLFARNAKNAIESMWVKPNP
jgi:poly-gamma-glutamate synthesis protein (capsule biosynthesis protein)